MRNAAGTYRAFRVVIVIASAALALDAAVLVFMRAPRFRPDRVVELDPAQALAVRHERAEVLVAQGLRLAALSEDGRAKGGQDLSAPVSGLSWSQDALWSLNGRAPVVERRSGENTVAFPLSHVPVAVSARDRYLWTLEKGGRKIHQFQISPTILGLRLVLVGVYSLPGLAAEGFAVDETGLLWITDRDSRRLYRLRLEGSSYLPVISAPLAPLIGPPGEVSGLSVEGGVVWLLVRPEGSARSYLHRIPTKLLNWTPDEHGGRPG